MDALEVATKNTKRAKRRSDKLVRAREHEQEEPSAAEVAVRAREAAAASSARYGRMPVRYVLQRTLREYGRDGCSDLAAGLTYFSVLSALPALLALVSVLGLLGAGRAGSKSLIEVVDTVAPQQVQPILSGLIAQLTSSSAAGIGLAVGIVGAVWSASGYVGAFGRAVNRIYGVREGRTAIVLRSGQLLITVIVLVLAVLVVLSLALSGPLVRSIGDVLGIGDAAFATWGVVKWPLVAVAVVLAVVALYFGTPNLRHQRIRYVAIGAGLAVVVMVIGSLVFGFYVANFASYNRVYGAVGGLLVALLWVWLTNVALVLGAELGSELQRGHELSIGLPAERSIRLEPRGEKASAKVAAKRSTDERVGAAIRTATAAEHAVHG